MNNIRHLIFGFFGALSALSCSTTADQTSTPCDLDVPTAAYQSPVGFGETLNFLTFGPAGATYQWSGPNGFTSQEQNPSIPNADLSMSGTYSLVITVDDCTSEPGTVDVFIEPCDVASPQASYFILAGTEVTLKLEASLVSGAVYNWTGPNGFVSHEQNPSIANFSGNANLLGTYSVAVSLGACVSAPATVNVTAESCNPETPQPFYNTGLTEGQSLTLQTASVSGATYQWTGPNGFTSTEQNPIIPNASYNSVGTFTVSTRVGNCVSQPGNVSVGMIPSVANCNPQVPTNYIRFEGGSTLPITGGNAYNPATQMMSVNVNNWIIIYIKFAGIEGYPPAGVYPFGTGQVGLGWTSGSTGTRVVSGDLYVSYLPNGTMHVSFCDLQTMGNTIPPLGPDQPSTPISGNF